MTMPISRQIKFIQKEIAFREKVYKRLILPGDDSRDEVETELEELKAILETLRSLPESA
jgi:hypothetical protein